MVESRAACFSLVRSDSSYDKYIHRRQLDLVLAAGSRLEVVVEEADGSLVPIDVQHPPLAVSLGLISNACFVVSSTTGAAQSYSGGHIGIGNEWSKWNFYKADYHLLYTRLLSVDWGTLYSLSDVDEMVVYFYTVIYGILDECVPKKSLLTVNRNSRYKYPAWYTKDLIDLIKKKARLHKRYKQTKTTCEYQEFSKCRKDVKNSIESAYKFHLDKIQNQFSIDPKSFWQHVKDHTRPLKREGIVKDGTNLTEEESANEFAQFFKSVYSTETPQLDVNAAAAYGTSSARVHLDDFTLREVSEALVRLKPKRSAGPDGLPPFLFRDYDKNVSIKTNKTTNINVNDAYEKLLLPMGTYNSTAADIFI
ncbi:uncharacterized protein LOC125058122 [Pieris napi]|uniref:uncharacterized protein LOC125058122 n=1 Tax=Pieris napi TaxID=78633 RepID=UPI001FBC0835|nr:uncharacterized protein LOC125058122 [Pieris napi]